MRSLLQPGFVGAWWSASAICGHIVALMHLGARPMTLLFKSQSGSVIVSRHFTALHATTHSLSVASTLTAILQHVSLTSPAWLARLYVVFIYGLGRHTVPLLIHSWILYLMAASSTFFHASGRNVSYTVLRLLPKVIMLLMAIVAAEADTLPPAATSAEARTTSSNLLAPLFWQSIIYPLGLSSHVAVLLMECLLVATISAVEQGGHAALHISFLVQLGAIVVGSTAVVTFIGARVQRMAQQQPQQLGRPAKEGVEHGQCGCSRLLAAGTAVCSATVAQAGKACRRSFELSSDATRAVPALVRSLSDPLRRRDRSGAREVPQPLHRQPSSTADAAKADAAQQPVVLKAAGWAKQQQQQLKQSPFAATKRHVAPAFSPHSLLSDASLGLPRQIRELLAQQLAAVGAAPKPSAAAPLLLYQPLCELTTLSVKVHHKPASFTGYSEQLTSSVAPAMTVDRAMSAPVLMQSVCIRGCVHLLGYVLQLRSDLADRLQRLGSGSSSCGSRDECHAGGAGRRAAHLRQLVGRIRAAVPCARATAVDISLGSSRACYSSAEAVAAVAAPGGTMANAWQEPSPAAAAPDALAAAVAAGGPAAAVAARIPLTPRCLATGTPSELQVTVASGGKPHRVVVFEAGRAVVNLQLPSDRCTEGAVLRVPVPALEGPVAGVAVLLGEATVAASQPVLIVPAEVAAELNGLGQLVPATPVGATADAVAAASGWRAWQDCMDALVRDLAYLLTAVADSSAVAPQQQQIDTLAAHVTQFLSAHGATAAMAFVLRHVYATLLRGRDQRPAADAAAPTNLPSPFAAFNVQPFVTVAEQRGPGGVCAEQQQQQRGLEATCSAMPTQGLRPACDSRGAPAMDATSSGTTAATAPGGPDSSPLLRAVPDDVVGATLRGGYADVALEETYQLHKHVHMALLDVVAAILHFSVIVASVQEALLQRTAGAGGAGGSRSAVGFSSCASLAMYCVLLMARYLHGPQPWHRQQLLLLQRLVSICTSLAVALGALQLSAGRIAQLHLTELGWLLGMGVVGPMMWQVNFVPAHLAAAALEAVAGVVMNYSCGVALGTALVKHSLVLVLSCATMLVMELRNRLQFVRSLRRAPHVKGKAA